MSDFDERSITTEVLATFDRCEDPRLKTIMQTVVRHAHDLVRELELTTEEWAYAVDYLTRTGHMCDERRQEFILLSDTLGISMLVDAINNRAPEPATQSTVLGPFFVQAAPVAKNGAQIGTGPGEPMYVDALIADLAGKPLAGATVDVWHSDEDGNYDIQYGPEAELNRRARFHTGSDGRVRFWSTLPTSYPIPHDGPVGQMLASVGRGPYRPAHLHFMIEAAGYKKLVTHIFVRGDEYLANDVVFGVKESLIDDYPAHPAGTVPDGRTMDEPYRTLEWTFRLPTLSESGRGSYVGLGDGSGDGDAGEAVPDDGPLAADGLGERSASC